MAAENIKRPALIVGSAPISSRLINCDLGKFHRIALNKAWMLRDDFEFHVFLRSLKSEFRPPNSYPARQVGFDSFNPALNAAGGLYLCSGSVAMIAGYWAIGRLNMPTISYYGCDLVFPTEKEGKTHFYGSGDKGPLFNNFEYNKRQYERSIRLFCWGLLHHVLVVNASAEPGTALAFPHVPLEAGYRGLQREVLRSKTTKEVIALSGVALAEELSKRSDTFSRKQRIFEADSEAINAMHECMDLWLGLAPCIEELGDLVAAKL